MRAPFELLLVTDRKQVAAGSLIGLVDSALGGGIDAVQLREKDLSTRELHTLAVQLRALTKRHNAKLLINDRIDVALAVQADGVHLPANSFDPSDARALLGATALIGVSTHAVDQAVAAEQAGADYIVFGPIYATASKQQYGAPVGLAALAQVTAKVRVPVIAIGGIDAAHISDVKRRGASGVAVISAILSATDPGAAAKELRHSLVGMNPRSRSSPPVRVRVVRSAADRAAAFDIRLRVFHREQGIAREEEFDADDDVATHVLAYCEGEPVATGRLVGHADFAKIGRMAVLATHRRSGVGKAIIRRLIALGRARGYERFVLHAQVQALSFYAALGFAAVGDEFDEAGIPHRKMERTVRKRPSGIGRTRK